MSAGEPLVLDEHEQEAWDRFAAAAIVRNADAWDACARSACHLADAMILERRRRQRQKPTRASVPDFGPATRGRR